MSGYIPATEEIRAAWTDEYPYPDGVLFDRWLAVEHAKAWAEGYAVRALEEDADV